MYYDTVPEIPTGGFVSKWMTSYTSAGSSAANQIQLPTTAASTYNMTVEWGDGTSSVITSYEDADVLHTYASPGEYYIKVTGSDVGSFVFNNAGDRNKLIDVYEWGDFDLDLHSHFYGCENFTGANMPPGSGPNISTTTFLDMFRGCTVFNGSINVWTTPAITTLQNCFRDCVAFNQPLQGGEPGILLDTDVNLDYAFYNCSLFNQSLDNLAPLTAVSTFQNAAAFNQDLSSWIVSSLFDATEFLVGGTSFSLANYDLLLVSWSGQTLESSVPLDMDPSTQYSNGAAHFTLTSPPNSWIISDGGNID